MEKEENPNQENTTAEPSLENNEDNQQSSAKNEEIKVA